MNKSKLLKLQTILKKTLPLLIPILSLIILLNVPFLHQTLANNITTHFTIIDSITTDIAEKQFNTLYFISHIFSK